MPNDPRLVVGLVSITDPHGITNLVDHRVWFDANPTPFPTTQCLRVSHGMCVEPTHISIHGNNLRTMTKDPTTQSDLPYMGKRTPRSWDPPLHREIPPVSKD